MSETSHDNHELDKEVRKEIKENAEQGSGFNGKFFRAKKPFRAALSKPMPFEAIQKHPSKSFLSTIKAIYIIERLNEVFGILGWDFEHEVVGQFPNTDKDGEVVQQIVVRGRIYIREFDLYTPVQYGGKNLDGKGQEPVDAFKSAVTDALTKCASFLEIGIQVFKGKPNDQTSNKSRRRDDGEDEKETQEPSSESVIKHAERREPKPSEPAHEPYKEDGDAVEMEELREKHKEVFGKYPNKNWSAETVASRIEEKDDEDDDDKVDTDDNVTGTMSQREELPTAPPPSDFPEVNAPEPTSAVTPNNEFDYMPLKSDDEPEEVEAEDVESNGAYYEALKKIESYIDATTLKNEAGNIVFDAQMDGASDEEIKLIKKAVNDTYTKLLK